jgi:very-short-patch-repair endonuclease
VKAVCRKHGPFEALPYAFYNGVACPECIREANSERMYSDIETFKVKYKERYGERLIFDKSVYKGSSVKMLVTCPIHGDFWRTPNKLLSGFGCHVCAKEKFKKEKTLTQEEFLKRIHDNFGDKYDTSIAQYERARGRVKLICPEHGVFEQTEEMLFNGYGCPHCSNQTSIKEREIIDFITSLVGEDDITIKDRSVLDGKEIDILIPSLKIGIEYNGNWWHSEGKGKDRNYHVSKTNLAESKGYRLIQIFEDEYMEKKDIVLEKIRHILGKDGEKIKIGARKCSIIEIEKDTAKLFLDKWHIQGFAPATVYYGAFYNGTLVGVMTFLKDKEGFWNLNRYSTDTLYSIPGLASKLFKNFLRHNNVVQVKSFLDRRWGKSGNSVYEKMGFALDSIEAPDYRYLVSGKRVHKFNFRKQTLNKKYGLPMTMTETEMVKELGIPRVWDCGLIKYVYRT